MLCHVSSTVIWPVLFELAKLWEQMLETVATTPGFHRNYRLNALYLDVVDLMNSCKEHISSLRLDLAFFDSHHPLCNNVLAPIMKHHIWGKGEVQAHISRLWDPWAKADAARLVSEIQRLTKRTPDRAVDRAQAMVAELRARVLAACEAYKNECQAASKRAKEPSEPSTTEQTRLDALAAACRSSGFAGPPDIPPLDKDSGKWVTNKLAAKLDGPKVETLAKYRQPGQAQWVSRDGMGGVDRDGRMWRRTGTPRSHPWYLRSTLTSTPK